MEITKTYYLAGLENIETGKVEIYSGGGSCPNFCILGKGLGKCYVTEKAALERLKSIKESYYKIYTDKFFLKTKFCIYKINVKIEEGKDINNENIS